MLGAEAQSPSRAHLQTSQPASSRHTILCPNRQLKVQASPSCIMNCVMLARDWTGLACLDLEAARKKRGDVLQQLVWTCRNRGTSGAWVSGQHHASCYNVLCGVQGALSARCVRLQRVDARGPMMQGIGSNGFAARAALATEVLHEVENVSGPELIGGLAPTEISRAVALDVRKLCYQGRLASALNLIDEHDLQVDSETIGLILQTCIKRKVLKEGERVRTLLIKHNLYANKYFRNNLIRLYTSCNHTERARREFDSMERRNLFSWTAMITGYVLNDQGREGLNLFFEMQDSDVKPSGQLLVSVLSACAKLRSLEDGERVHRLICDEGLNLNQFVQNSLIDMYSKCQNVEAARQVFDSMLRRDVVSWNAMIAGYASNGHTLKAFTLYRKLQSAGVKPTKITYVCVLNACTDAGHLNHGKLIHRDVVQRGFESDVIVGTAVQCMYLRCGAILDAHIVFRKLSTRDVVSWTAMISGCNQYGLCKEARELFQQMQLEGVRPNRSSYGAVLVACAKDAAVVEGTQIHAIVRKVGLETDVSVGTNLIHMYASFGNMQQARQIFDSLSRKNVVTWSMLIAGYILNGEYGETYELFPRMLQDGHTPTQTTFIKLLEACTVPAAVEVGKWLQSQAAKILVEPDSDLDTAVLLMYKRCGFGKETKAAEGTQSNSIAAPVPGDWEHIATMKKAVSAADLETRDLVAAVQKKVAAPGPQKWEHIATVKKKPSAPVLDKRVHISPVQKEQVASLDGRWEHIVSVKQR